MDIIGIIRTIFGKAKDFGEYEADRFADQASKTAKRTMDMADEYEQSHPNMSSEQRQKVDEARQKAHKANATAEKIRNRDF